MALAKWIPTTDLMMLRRMGKMLEELCELGNVAARCIIQGIDEKDPGSGEFNRQRLWKETADVYAQLDETAERLKIPAEFIEARRAEKRRQMQEWEAMFEGAGAVLAGVIDAEALSDAIHKNLFPRADAVHRMANSRQVIADLIRQHLQQPVADKAYDPRVVTERMRIAGFESEAWQKLSDAVVDTRGWPYSCREAGNCVEGIYLAMEAARD